MAVLDKIVPLDHVVDVDPVPIDVINASAWFTTETMTYRDNDSNDLLPWYLAQGWSILNRTSFTYVYSYDIYGRLIGTRSYFVYELSRRKLQAERALNDLIADFTAAYNDGRSINDQRYDEILTIHSLMLDEREDEINTQGVTITAHEAEVDPIIALMLADFTAFDLAVSTQLDDFGESERDRINTQFDAESSAVNSRLVSNGLYNTTVWATANTGVEESRARALTVANDSIKDRTLTHEHRVYEAQRSMREGMMAAFERVVILKRDDANTSTEMRNRVLVAMLGFMERRVDDYPGLENLSNIAASIGFTDTGAIVKP